MARQVGCALVNWFSGWVLIDGSTSVRGCAKVPTVSAVDSARLPSFALVVIYKSLPTFALKNLGVGRLHTARITPRPSDTSEAPMARHSHHSPARTRPRRLGTPAWHTGRTPHLDQKNEQSVSGITPV